MDTGIGDKENTGQHLRYILGIRCSRGSNSEYRPVKLGNNVKPLQKV